MPWAALTYVRLKRFLHILQLEEYLTPQFLHWLAVSVRRYLSPPLVLAGGGVSLLLLIALTLDSDRAIWAAITAWGLTCVSLILRGRSQQPKKPLVMTSRARRLLLTGEVLDLGIIGLAVGLGLLGGEREAIAAGVVATFVACLLAGHVLVIANLSLWPFEEMSRRRFQRMAARKLREKRPRIIAITGSAGKTTTKELVAHLLSARHRVLKTPASFNTPLGIARTVNDSYDGQEFFVVEMGAYKRGEIERLCRLVGGADVSVITTVNAQHIERFGSLVATAEAKFEIVEGLRPGGTEVLNFDVAAIRELVMTRVPFGAAQGMLRHRFGAQDERVDNRPTSEQTGIEVLAFGVESEDVGLRGTNVVETQTGVEFDVTYRGEKAHVVTQLLARHNAGNVLAAIGVGLTCGLELAYMAAAIRQFAPPEHRLQPVQLGNGVTVLDDAYNANPEGIIGALEVLGRYAPRRRIVVTPGLIEMGREKASYHGRIGRAAAKWADVAVLVGPKQTADIKAAMLEASFPPDRLHVARGFAEAQDMLRRVGEPGDVILYANDLPDQFDEFLVI